MPISLIMVRIMKTKISLALAIILLIAFIGLGIVNVRKSNHKVQLQQIELKDNSVKLKQLNEEYNKLLDSKTIDQQKLDELQKQKDELEKQLQAKLERQEAERVAMQKASQVATITAYAAQANCGSPKACIYMKESGNNPAAVNSIGCRGIGQACPGSKLPCSDSDYACQDAWFTNYAVTRYGGWDQAWQFWQSHHWW